MTDDAARTGAHHGVRVDARPFYLPEHSEPPGRYAFGYEITIRNEGSVRVQLLDRHWRITDALGRTQDVRGLGVVGQQPKLEPGESYTYSSFCPLTTPYGTMEGTFGMIAPDGARFEVNVPLFTLQSPERVTN